MAALCEALVCGRSLAGIAGSNSAGGMNVCLFERCVLSGSDGLMPSPEESYLVCVCVCVCVRACVRERERERERDQFNNNPLHQQ